MRRIHQPTLFILTAILLLAFALRLVNLSVSDYDVDEIWTHTQVMYTRNPETADQIYREPNNITHILLTIPLANIVDAKIGFRFWSVAAGLLSIAVMMRLTFRLSGRQGAWIAGLLSAFAFVVLDYSQHVRPYMFAYLFALLATLMWVERRPRLNMMFSMLVPLFHIGAVPILLMQDVITAFKPRRWRYRNHRDWLFRRLPAYAMLLLILFLVYLRREAGKVISSGQPSPQPLEILNNWILNSVGAELPTLAALLFLVAVGLALVLGWQRVKRENLLIPVLWIGLSYLALVIMSLVSDGPIKFFHLMHIGYATALLLVLLLASSPSWLRGGVVALVVVATLPSLYHFYTHPNDQYTRAYDSLQAWHDDQTIYYEVIFSVQGLILAADEPVTFLEFISEDGDYPTDPYYYLAYLDFDPPLPDTCPSESVWSENGFHLHLCNADE